MALLHSRAHHQPQPGQARPGLVGALLLPPHLAGPPGGGGGGQSEAGPEAESLPGPRQLAGGPDSACRGQSGHSQPHLS